MTIFVKQTVGKDMINVLPLTDISLFPAWWSSLAAPSSRSLGRGLSGIERVCHKEEHDPNLGPSLLGPG